MERRASIQLTGTKNNTPVTIEVKAVPFPLLEWIFPSNPMVKAPIAETISERLKMCRLATVLAVYAAQEMSTMMVSLRLFSHPVIGCRFASEDMSENTGTMMN